MDIPVVVATADGKRLKGTIACFNPTYATLSLQLMQSEGAPADVLELDIGDIDAVFFVRQLANDRSVRLTDQRNDDESSWGEPSGASSRILLRSGETLEGVTEFPAEDRNGLFLIPSGPAARAGNTAGVWISTRAVVEAWPLGKDHGLHERPPEPTKSETADSREVPAIDRRPASRGVRFRRRRFF